MTKMVGEKVTKMVGEKPQKSDKNGRLYNNIIIYIIIYNIIKFYNKDGGANAHAG